MSGKIIIPPKPLVVRPFKTSLTIVIEVDEKTGTTKSNTSRPVTVLEILSIYLDYAQQSVQQLEGNKDLSNNHQTVTNHILHGLIGFAQQTLAQIAHPPKQQGTNDGVSPPKDKPDA